MGAPSLGTIGRALFLEELHSSGLPELLARYEPEARVAQILETNLGTYPAAEMLVAASANSPAGTGTEVSSEDAERIMDLASQLLLRMPISSGPEAYQVSLLRTLRGIRPAWLTAPIFERILRPFDSALRERFGATSAEMFGAVIAISDAVPGGHPISMALFNPLPHECLIDHDAIHEPADLWNFGVVRVGHTVIPLGRRLAEVVYRIACRELASRGGHFTDRKGDSLERVVREEISAIAPRWRWIPNYTIEGDDGSEKDLLGVGPGVGVAIEAKAVVVRRRAADWSVRDLVSDLGPVRDAKTQLEMPTALLRRGGRVKWAGGVEPVGPVRLALPLVVTDEPLSAIIEGHSATAHRAGSPADPEDSNAPLPCAVLSVIDLALVARVSGTPAVFLDYWRWRGRHPSTRTLDTPESWIFYGTDPILKWTTEGDAMASEANEWEDVRELGYRSIRPPWIYRWDAIELAESRGDTQKALRLVDGDRRASAVRFPNAVHSKQRTEFWTRNSKLLRRDGYQMTVKDRFESKVGGESALSLRRPRWVP